MRKYFDLVEHEALILEIDNDDGSFSAIDFRDARVAAEIANLHANILSQFDPSTRNVFFTLSSWAMRIRSTLMA